MIRQGLKVIGGFFCVFFYLFFLGGSSIYAQEVEGFEKNREVIPDQIIVKLKSQVSEQNFKSLNDKYKFSVIDENSKYGYKLLQFSSSVELHEITESLKKNPMIENVEFNHEIKASIIPNDPYFNWQWGLKKVQADMAWDLAEGSDNVVVAVLDTGIDSSHPDLKDKIMVGKTFVNEANPLDTADGNGHGTHVAGIIGAVMGNYAGVAGIAPGVRLLPVKVLNDDGYGSDWTVAQGIDFAAASGAKIINMSLGSYYGSGVIQAAVNNAIQKGVLLVAAAGNDGLDHVNYPAAYSGVLAVSALDSNDSLANFTNYGDQISLAAPGVNILSTYSGPGADPSNPYVYMSGTSMATPFVAGLAALVLSEDPSLTAASVKDTLRFSADDLGAVGKDVKFGYGRINAYKAVNFGKISINFEKNTVEKGEPVNISISICDIFGNPKTDVSGYVNLKAFNPGLQLPLLPVEIKNGVWEGQVVAEATGTYTISASDAGETVKWLGGDSPVLNVTDPFPVRLSWDMPDSVSVGEVVYSTVYAVDMYGKVCSDYQGKIEILCDNDDTDIPDYPVDVGTPFPVGFYGDGSVVLSVYDQGGVLESTSVCVQVYPVVTQGITGKVLLEGKTLHGGITVEIPGTDRVVSTNVDGYFEITDLPEGSYDLWITFNRYLTVKIGPINVSQGILTTLPELWMKAGDVNGNNVIDLFDFVILAHAYGADSGDTRWNVFADIVVDSRIDVNDLFWLAKNYGEKGWE